MDAHRPIATDGFSQINVRGLSCGGPALRRNGIAKLYNDLAARHRFTLEHFRSHVLAC
jgi:hypothetical protein